MSQGLDYARRAVSMLGAVLVCAAPWAACTTQGPSLPSDPPVPPIDAGVELPQGEGRTILEASCLSCHRLEALGLFKGYYDRDRWRALVVTMVAAGADVNDTEVEVLSDYLEQHFGLGTR